MSSPGDSKPPSQSPSKADTAKKEENAPKDSKANTPKESKANTPKESKENTPKSSKADLPKSTSKEETRKSSDKSVVIVDDDPDMTKSDFIYGGPFIKHPKPSPYLEMICPYNIPQQGTFRNSYAYVSLKERLPIILTKLTEYLQSSKVDAKNVIENINKLKRALLNNDTYENFTFASDECRDWNKWIAQLDNVHYFNNSMIWTECYVYRKIKEFCQLRELKDFDYFAEMKDKCFNTALEPICVAAETVITMLEKSEKDKRKQDFIMLLKLSLWSNKLDLHHSLCEQVKMEMPDPPPPKKAPKPKKGEPPPPPKPENEGPKPPELVDVVKMIGLLKDKMLADDSAKVADNICAKADKMREQIKKKMNGPFKERCSCHRLAVLAGVKQCKDPELEAEAERLAAEAKAAKGKGKGKEKPPPAPPLEEGAEPPPPPPRPTPCPAKLTVPQIVAFDIVCENVGYDLFMDMCLAHFLIAQEVVSKVRFHVKKYPWFVSNVTSRDITALINSCKSATYSAEYPAPPKPPPPEGEPAPEPDPPRQVNANAVKELGNAWEGYIANGTFLILEEDYWTYPHTYNEMKKYDPQQYRRLQLSCGILFKGDLNFRKLIGDRNTNPYLGIEPALQGFLPAPIIVVRVVKSEVIAGCGKGKFDAVNKLGDDKWMQKGIYGQINLCKKAEALKPSTMPCFDYCETCLGRGCPKHDEF